MRLQPLLCTASWIVKPRLLSPPMTKQHSIPSSVSHQLTRPQLHILTVYRRHHHHQILLSSSRTEMGLGHLKEAEKDTGKRYKQQTLRHFTAFTGHMEGSQAMSPDVTNIAASLRRKSTTWCGLGGRSKCVSTSLWAAHVTTSSRHSEPRAEVSPGPVRCTLGIQPGY